jgi:hypothetical protein
LQDNDSIDQLRYLSISLEESAEVSISSSSGSTTVNITENDAVWQGILETDVGTLGFELEILNGEFGTFCDFSGGDFGFFPTNALPTQISFSESQFSASITNISMDASSSLFNTPMELQLTLSANDALENESVGINSVEGNCVFIINLPAMPHLNSTNTGTFFLQQPPVAPSTNEVELVDIPYGE